MYHIDPNLYATNAFYRNIVDEMLTMEQEKRQLQMKEDHLKAEQEAYCRQQMIDYPNQIPYSRMTSVNSRQWRAPYAMMRDNFESYWTQQGEQGGMVQPKNFRAAFHSAVDMSATAMKQKDPIASILLDGIGFMTAGSLWEAIKSLFSALDTAMGCSETTEKNG